jgi:hypothetical protein
MPTLMMFYEFAPGQKAGQQGFNKAGYVTNDGFVLYAGQWRVKRRSFEKLKNRRHGLLKLPQEYDTHAGNIETFFTRNKLDWYLFNMGMEALRDKKFSFFDSPIKRPILHPLTAEEFETRWTGFLAHLQRGDLITTLDTQSILSRMIAAADHGVWSHIGMCTGNGRIAEAITSGVVERSVEAYHTPRYRLGIYRTKRSDADKEYAIRYFSSQVGKSYDYRSVIKVGLKILLGIQRKEGEATPNDFALSPDIVLIFVV